MKNVKLKIEKRERGGVGQFCIFNF